MAPRDFNRYDPRRLRGLADRRDGNIIHPIGWRPSRGVIQGGIPAEAKISRRGRTIQGGGADQVTGKPKLSKQQIARLTGQLQRLRAGNRAAGTDMPQPLSNRVNRIRGMLAGRRSGTKVAGAPPGQPPPGLPAPSPNPIPFTPPPGGPKFPTGDFGGVGQKPPPPMVPPRRRRPIRGGY